MESFQTASVIRFYGSAGEAEVDDLVPVDVAPVESASPPELPLVRLRPSRAPGVIATLATLAGIAAVGLATWAFVTVVRSVDDEPPPSPPVKPKPARQAAPVKVKPNRALALLALPSTERYRMAGSVGRITLAVVPGDRGYLALNGLWQAPRGRTYVAWLVPPAGRTIRSAATFRGGTGLVPLRGQVAAGSAVAVTLEHGRTASGPTRTPRLVAIRRPT